MSARPSVLFVCVRNGGKSQMAAGLLRRDAGDLVDVHSAGTTPGSSINELSAQVLDEPSDRGIDGIERMRLVRDDIAERVASLLEELTDGTASRQ